MYKLLTAAAALLVLLVGIGQSKNNLRAYVAGKFALQLDRSTPSWVLSADGGSPEADVVVTANPGDPFFRKLPGRVKYGDITLKMGANFLNDKALLAWIQDTALGKAPRKNGAVIAANFDGKEHGSLQFEEALITEISLPALDAASKDAAKITVKFQPEFTLRTEGTGSEVPAPPATKQKTWLPANFRLRIDGVDTSVLAKVNKIEAFTIKQGVKEDRLGEQRRYEIVPGQMEIPNLKISVGAADAKPFYDWFDDFVLNGNSKVEKKGGIDYLSSDQKTVLFTVNFTNLGIFKVAPEETEANQDGLRRVHAEMYCEEVSLHYGAAAP